MNEAKLSTDHVPEGEPRAGEHVPSLSEGLRLTAPSYIYQRALKLEAESHLLREREKELAETLRELVGDVEDIYDRCKRRDLMIVSIGQFRRLNAPRAALAKHGR
jgi:hypothetical protein